jgi:hypothetical protein
MIKKILTTLLLTAVLGETLLFVAILVIVQPGAESRIRLAAGAFGYLNIVFGPAFLVGIALLSIVATLVSNHHHGDRL